MKETNRNIDWKYKKALKEAGITLEVLEKSTGINRALLSMYGNGKYVFGRLERHKIAKTLGMSENEIFTQF